MKDAWLLLMTNGTQCRGSKQKLNSRGFTLLELMVTLAIAGILAVMVAPSFQESIRRNARESAMLGLMSSISFARTSGVTQSRIITICRSTNQTNCAESDGLDWDDGWIVFSDTGVAGTLDGTDELLQVEPAGNGQSTITLEDGTGADMVGDFLQVDEDGFLENTTTGALYKFCDPDNVQANIRAVWIGNTGRAAMSQDGGDGIHNDMSGANLSCP